jgi:iron complex transport system substrate-binding protein
MKRIYYIVLLLVVASGVISCGSRVIKNTDGELIKNKYSDGFEISRIEEGFILKVKNRFDESGATYNYLLSSSSESESDNNVIIHIPVTKVVCLSTTHCAFISKLDRISTIQGISSPEYVYDDKIRDMILNGDITDIGFESQINYEKIISMNPDVVFAFGVDNAGVASFQKLTDIGIPVVFVGDFTEATPLGRTEWIKFFACFYDRLDYATEYFDSVEKNYNTIKEDIAKLNKKKPKVMVSLPWKGTWWVPGGNSFFANFISDAGGEYIFSNNESDESISLTIEEVFAQAKDAEFWFHPNNADNKRSIVEVDSRLTDFAPFKHAEIYNNNKRQNRYGGNDFWESGIIHPDLILKDLQQIMFPESLSNTDLYYYKKLE